MYTPDRGDIIWLDFEPSVGKEITKRRPAYVVSRKAFNEHTGFALVAPITSTVRNVRLEVVLEGTETEGAILSYQMKSFDFEQRQAVLIEKAPGAIIAAMTQILQVIVR
ncbi:MAG: type II toxin-antitoxin system PemK/MazF family toxin [Halieaceae bacterium]|jgi:mRNA-degrading endonuclease toxin of MazEF toxin-antitoxin module|nr:type II toxin-antitoxin system PemK/MazF family toxin [Halieaceae bacterium]